MTMPVLQKSERHCPIWHCSFESEARDCRLDRRRFCFAVLYWLDHYSLKRWQKNLHFRFLADGPAFAHATARQACVFSRNNFSERREKTLHL